MTKRAWAWVLGGYVIMALGFVIVAFILANQISTNKQNVALIKSTQAALATTAVHNAGAICLGLTAPTKEQEMAIVQAFLEGDGAITDQFTPTCARAAQKAASDIFNGHLPDALQDELNRVLNR